MPNINRRVTLGIFGDTKDLAAKLGWVKAEKEKVEKEGIDVPVDANTKRASVNLDELRAKLRLLSEKTTSTRVDTDDKEAVAKLALINSRLSSLDRKVSTPRISVTGADRALADIAALDLALDRLDKKNVKPKTFMGRIGSAAGNAGGALGSIGSDITPALGNPYVAGGVAGTLAATAPFAGQAVGGTLVAGLGAAMAGMGILGASKLKPVQEAFDKLSDTANKDLEKIGKPFEPVLIHLMGTAESVMGKMTPVFTGAEKIIAPAFQRIGDTLIKAFNQPAVTKSIDAVAKAFAAIMKSLSPVIPGLARELGNAITAMANNIAKNPKAFTDFINFLAHIVIFAVNAVNGLTVAANYLEKHFVPACQHVINWVKEMFDPKYLMSGALVTALGVAWRAVEGFAKNVGSAISGAWNTVRNRTVSVWNGVRSFLGGVWSGIRNVAVGVFNGVRNFFTGVWNGARNTTTGVWHSIANFLGGIWNNIRNTAGTVFRAVSRVIISIWNAITIPFKVTALILIGLAGMAWLGIKNLTHMIWPSIHNFLVNTWNGIKGVFGGALNACRNAVHGAWNWITTTSHNIWNNLRAWFVGNWNALKSIFAGPLGWIRNTARSAWNWIVNVSHNIWNNLRAWFVGNWNALKAIFAGPLGWIRNTARAAWNWITTVSHNIWNALRAWFVGNWNALKAIFGGPLGTLRNAMRDAWNWIANTSHNIWNRLRAWFVGNWNAMKAIFGGPLNTLRNAMRDAWNWIANVSHNIWNNIRAWFVGNWNNIKRIFANPINSIKNTVRAGWNWIHDTTVKVFNKVTSFFGGFWRNLHNGFNNFVGGLRKVWNAISGPNGVFGKPVNWVAQHIYNPFANFVNKGLGVFGISQRLPTMKFARGGRVPGYDPHGRDRVPAMLTEGEFVVNAKQTQKHRQTLEAINKGYDDGAVHLAKGGIVPFVKGLVGGITGQAAKAGAKKAGGALGGIAEGVGAGIAGLPAAHAAVPIVKAAWHTAEAAIKGIGNFISQLNMTPGKSAIRNMDVTAIKTILNGAIGAARANESSGSAAGLAKLAEKYNGHKYVWGGPANAKSGFDCSSFVNMLAGMMGLPIPGGFHAPSNSHGPATTSWLTFNKMKKVPGNQMSADDLYVNSHHMGVVTGKGRGFAARSTATGTGPQSVSEALYTILRFPGGGKYPNKHGGGIPQNAQAIANFLSRKGANRIAIAGILGNIQQESGGNPNAGSNPPGKGLIQILGDPGGSLNADLNRTWNYIQANGGIGPINRAGSAAGAATVFCNRYERPGIPALGNRIANANACFAAGYDKGGILPPGKTLAVNNTGHNEYVVNPALGGLGNHVEVHVHVAGHALASKQEIGRTVSDALKQFERKGGKV